MTESTYSRENRAKFLALFFGLLLLALSVRLLIMQTSEHEKYYLMSEENRIRIVPEVAFRGIVYDRDWHVLVENRPSYTISAIPNEIKNIPEISERLAEVLDQSADEIEDKIYSKRFLRYKPIKIARSVDFETVCRIEENADKYPGIIFQLEPARQYPRAGVLSHVVGYTGEISEKELKEFKGQGINRGTELGREGIEKYWDKYLRGRDGLEYLEITAEGKILGNMKERENIPAVPGKDIMLSLDFDLQTYVASLFSDTLSGACVALDPNNGEILAFASIPAYDANIFSGMLKSSDWQAVISNPQKPLLNRVIKGEYTPGSTFKLMVAGAALEEGVIDLNTRFQACRGAYRFGNRPFKCWYAPGHGSLDVLGAIEQSCNVFFYQVGLKMGLEIYEEYARKCGFGSKTGVDIPGEMDGLVPSAGWYDRAYGKGQWTRAVLLNLAIGQGEILVTPLQLANFYAAVGNGGTLYRPHLLKEILSPNDTIIVRDEIIGHLPFSQKTLDILRTGATRVVQGEHGTARGSKIKGIHFAGKTGTAQNPHGPAHSWFAAWAPAEHPIIAIATIVENAGHGSEVAAPIVSKIIKYYLQKKGLLEPPVDSSRIAESGDSAQ